MIDTEIKILRELERELERAAALEVRNATRERRRPWKAWIGAAAAAVVVAWGIGWVAMNGLGPGSSSETKAGAGSFSTVGSAVNGEGGEPTPPSHSGSPGGTGSGQDLAKIVRDGNIAVVIPDGTFAERFDQATGVADRFGGFVLSQSTKGGESGSLVLRIPAQRFDAAMGAVGDLGRIASSEVTGKDVTADYIDQQARLTILKARRASLLRLLDRSTTLATSLALSDRVDDVQFDIERAQGQLRFLDAQVAESTLRVDMRESDTPAAESDTGDAIRNPSLGRAADRAEQGFLGVIATILVGLGYLLPLAILGGLGYAGWRVIKSRQAPAD
jgi:Domain of unknown function (DUF4349)